MILVVIYLAWMLFMALQTSGPRRGYYRYNDGYYYSQNDSWYYYDDGLFDWIPVAVDDELSENYSDYYESSGYSGSYGVDDFTDSGYYEESSGWSSDWDDDDDWDWGSDDWDSGWTDWDSDW